MAASPTHNISSFLNANAKGYILGWEQDESSIVFPTTPIWRLFAVRGTSKICLASTFHEPSKESIVQSFYDQGYLPIPNKLKAFL